MDWISVEEKLPPGRRRCLGICLQETGENSSWKGIIDVCFDPHIGWFRCEGKKRDINVIYWCVYPEIFPVKLLPLSDSNEE